MSLGMAGLYYYVGILLSALHQEDKYRRNLITPVYIGGNGSRLFHWLDDTERFGSYSEVNELFSRMLSLGSGFEDTEVRTQLSKKPGDEIACGLVLNHTQ